MRVLVTGATGFIGREVTAELVRGGRRVVALVRGPEPERRLAGAGIEAEVRAGELGQREPLELALDGCGAVVHLAALVDPTADDDERAQRLVNCDAAVELAELARAAGVRRFVFVSSIAAMGFFSGRATSATRCRPVTAYGRAKLEAERGILAMAGPSFDVIVLRPPTVYGPGERYNFLAWTRAVERGQFRVVGDGHNRFPLATTANVARTARAALDGRLGTGTFLVADRQPYSVQRIHRALLAALGRSEPRFRIPRPVAWAAGAANEAVCAAFPRLPRMLTRARVRTLTADQPFDVSPLLESAVQLDAPLEEWVSLTIRDYRRRGLIRA